MASTINHKTCCKKIWEMSTGVADWRVAVENTFPEKKKVFTIVFFRYVYTSMCIF
jgi:hypothetical protein